MTALIFVLSLVAAGVPPPLAQAPSDLHVVFERQFNYMSSIRTTPTDWWVAPGKSATRSGDRLTIRRDDLGIRWRVDLKAATYEEAKIEAAPPAPAADKEDIHTAGFNYEPDYEWQVSQTGQTSTLAGRPCRQFVASGDADYSEATVKFWLCEPIAGVNHAVTSQVTGGLFSDSSRRMVIDTAAKQGNAWALGIEETLQPAISPTIVMTVTVKSLEAAAAPAGTFELPANVKKAGAK